MKQVLFFLLFYSVSFAGFAQLDVPPRRALVISGGGSKGAWGVGVVDRLSGGKPYYNLIVGTSTGTLIAPLALLGKFDELRDAYTHLDSRDVLQDPENLRLLADGVFNDNFRLATLLAVSRNFQKGYISNSEPLPNLIERFFTPEYFHQLKNKFPHKNMYVSSLNLRNGKVVYHDLQSSDDKEQFYKWIWSSCSEPVYMSPYYKQNKDTVEMYVDGGIKDNVPLNKMLEIMFDPGSDSLYKYIDTIDVVIHNPSDIFNTNWQMGNTFGTLFRMLDIMRSDVRENDLKLDISTIRDGLNKVKDKNKSYEVGSKAEWLVVRKIFMPRDLVKLFEFELNFDPKSMQQAYKDGIGWESDHRVEVVWDSVDLNGVRRMFAAEDTLNAAIADFKQDEVDLDTFKKKMEIVLQLDPEQENARNLIHLINDHPKSGKKYIERRIPSDKYRIPGQKRKKNDTLLMTTEEPVWSEDDKKEIIRDIINKYEKIIPSKDLDSLKRKY